LSVQPKKGFFEKINPLNLLHSEKKPPNTTPVAPAAVQVASTEKPTPQPSSVPVSMKRYAYKSPAKPTSGDRSAANPLFAQGREDQNAKRYQDAIRAYQAALEKDPAFYEAQYNLGLAHSQTGNKPAGLVAYEAALAIDGKSLDARRNFALLLSESGYPLDAAHEFGTVIAEHPKDAGAELGLANVYAQQLKQPAAARQHYLRVLELEPKHIQADSIRRWLVSNP